MDIQYNSKCYTFEKKTYQNGLLNKSVDATYIIHLKNNGRYEHIEKQLAEYQPTNVVYIVLNQGYKKCGKKLIDQAPDQDLTDAFLQCFKHADENGYGNILILEDDFIFSPEVKNQSTLKTIDAFLNKKKDEAFIYYLGCVPLLILPYDWNHYISLKSLTCHSIVYSKKSRELFNKNIYHKHWDVILEKSISNKYLYCKPLCYQLFPETENKKTWAEKDKTALMGWLKNATINTLHLDKEAEFGFFVLYCISKILCILFVILALVFLYFTGRFVKKLLKYKISNKKNR
jgi:hypothetical protein